MNLTRTHKVSGWTRTPTGYGHWRIVPTDGSGDRIVAFMSRHSWANLPNDDRANEDRDRVVLVSGEPLPEWARDWLEKANARSCERARDAFRAALDDADWHSSSQDGW